MERDRREFGPVQLQLGQRGKKSEEHTFASYRAVKMVEHVHEVERWVRSLTGIQDGHDSVPERDPPWGACVVYEYVKEANPRFWNTLVTDGMYTVRPFSMLEDACS